MKQPIKKSLKRHVAGTLKPKKTVNKSSKNKKNEKYGTSTLEEKFAKNFLEKVGVNYV